MKIVKLISGGIDSSIMAQEYAGINVYIDFGQKYAKEEKEALNKQGIKYDIIKVEGNFNNNDIFIPNRNLTLASLISTIYDPDIIMMAGLKDDNCIDKNIEAFQDMSNVISKFTNKQVKIISPYFNKTKGEIIQQFKNKQSLINTFSCYKPIDNKPCGDCPACLRRVIALETNGIKTGIKLSDKILNKYISKIYTYEPDRISRFFIYLKQYKKVNAVDIDGILCEDKQQYSKRKPLKKNINKINKLDGYIVLYTSRLEIDRDITIKWLKKNKVKYHSLIMNKLPYSLLIDDLSINTLKVE